MSYPTWLLWLGGTLLPLGLLWLLWRLTLRAERCYGYNRTLLLLAPLLAAALPLLPHPRLPAWLAGGAGAASQAASVLLPAVPVGAGPAAATGWLGWPWLLALYWVGVLVGLGRLAWQVRRLHQLARQLPRLACPGYALVHTGGRLPTSTFGRVVFWDETAALAPAEAGAVLAHELAHVRQRHTRDVLWLQAWRAVLWPNPGAHLLLPALRLTHELLADRAAAEANPAEASAVPYAALLARLAARQLVGPAFSLLQPFTFSFTLTRIAMLKTQVPVRRWKQWLVLPVLGGVFLAACQTSPALEEAVPPPPRLLNTPQVAAGADHLYTFVEEMPHLPGGGGQQAIVEAIQAKLAYPKLEAGVSTGGRVFAQFTVGADGGVRDAKIVKGLTPACDEAVLAAIRQLPVFVAGKQAGTPVNVSFTVPVIFAIEP